MKGGKQQQQRTNIVRKYRIKIVHNLNLFAPFIRLCFRNYIAFKPSSFRVSGMVVGSLPVSRTVLTSAAIKCPLVAARSPFGK